MTLFLLFSFCGFLAQSILSAAFETSMVFFFCKEHVFGVDFFLIISAQIWGGTAQPQQHPRKVVLAQLTHLPNPLFCWVHVKI